MNWLFAAADPGGINAIMPLYRRLVSQGETAVFCVPLERMAFASAIIMNVFPIEHFFDVKNSFSPFQLEQLIQPDIIITGTSGQSRVELQLWEYARNKGILSIAILDYWGNYSLRFQVNRRHQHYLDTSPDEITYIYPNFIFTMNKFAKEQMISEGIPEDIIIVTGQPYFIDLLKERSDPRSSTHIILLMSEPLESMYHTLERYGFDEYSVMKTLETWRQRKGISEKIILKNHPKQLLDRERISEAFEIAPEVNGLQILKRSSLVFGTLTTALIEALILGKKVCALIPNRDFNQTSTLSKLGFSLNATSAEEIEDVLANQPDFDEVCTRLGIKDVSIELIVNQIRRLYDEQTGD